MLKMGRVWVGEGGGAMNEKGGRVCVLCSEGHSKTGGTFVAEVEEVGGVSLVGGGRQWTNNLSKVAAFHPSTSPFPSLQHLLG